MIELGQDVKIRKSQVIGIEPNIIKLQKTSNQLVTNTANAIITFNTMGLKKGDKLSFESNGVKIGKGVSLVEVTMRLWFENLVGYFMYGIMINGAVKTQNIANQNRSGNTWNEFWDTAHVSEDFEVTENDIINGYCRFNATHANNSVVGTYPDCSMLQVEVKD